MSSARNQPDEPSLNWSCARLACVRASTYLPATNSACAEASCEFGVSPNHAPVMSVIKPGALRVINDGAERRIFVNGGFADVTPEGLTVLAEEAIDLADIAPAQLEQDLKNAQEDLRDANTDAKKDAAQRALSRLEIIKAAMAR